MHEICELVCSILYVSHNNSINYYLHEILILCQYEDLGPNSQNHVAFLVTHHREPRIVVTTLIHFEMGPLHFNVNFSKIRAKIVIKTLVLNLMQFQDEMAC